MNPSLKKVYGYTKFGSSDSAYSVFSSWLPAVWTSTCVTVRELVSGNKTRMSYSCERFALQGFNL